MEKFNAQNKFVPMLGPYNPVEAVNQIGRCLFYAIPNGAAKVEVFFQRDTLWLTGTALAKMLGVGAPVVDQQLQVIFETGELAIDSALALFESPEATGTSHPTPYYNLDAIIAAGYRLNGPATTQFRLWAIQRLREREQTEAALKEREKAFRSLFDTGTTAVALLVGRKFQRVNSLMSQITGYTEAELLGQTTRIHYPDEAEYERVGRELYGAMERNEVGVLEARHRRKNGELYDVLLYARRLNTEAEGKATLVTVLDITDRKRAEVALRESEASLEAAQSLARIGSWVLDPETGAGTWSKELYNLFNFDPALGRPTFHDFVESVHPEDRAQLLERHQQMARAGGQAQFEFRSAPAHGPVRHFASVMQSTRKSAGPQGLWCLAGTVQDITEQKQLEANFLRAQRMEGIGALAGGIAHDLNNILQPILMSARLLREETTDPESREMLETVASSAQRGADIIKQLLTFARGTPGTRVPLPVRHLLHELEKIIRETFPRNIQLGMDAAQDLWLVMGDATQIHQALMNLCVNARDAMPDGGRLTLAAANVILDVAAAATTPDAKPGRHVCVSVTDTGTGIPPEVLDRIFDPFFTTKELGKGTGLGLATVLGILRGHGGFVRVKSQPGQGSSFELYFPASPETKAATPTEAEPRPPRANGELILLVDDEPSVRRVIQRTLERHGYQVVTAAEGAEALTLFARHGAEIRAVLTDMMMPGMDGPALIRAVRQQAPRLPIFGMTGIGERADIKGLEALNVAPLLTKPFNSTGLLGLLRQALASHLATGADAP